MESVDLYILQFQENIQTHLNTIRKLILENAPDCVEKISYGMPAYFLKKKPLIYFAAYKNHIGLYATPTGHSHFKDKLSNFKQGKGSVQFPIGSHIPFDIIEEIVLFRIKEINGK